ncbi:hypothetical protein [Actinomadura sp. DC4]|nr:hypothetical protein [Actinomadura sp. DC4]MDN3358983.1 hypothetical protein [Actinomadura sp. DC4]
MTDTLDHGVRPATAGGRVGLTRPAGPSSATYERAGDMMRKG